MQKETNTIVLSLHVYNKDKTAKEISPIYQLRPSFTPDDHHVMGHQNTVLGTHLQTNAY